MNDIAVEARNLRKTFRGGVVALAGLDIAVPRGSVYGLIGRNGVGKTTALRLLMGLLRPSEGAARVLGTDLWSADSSTRSRVAYVAQEQQLHDWMTIGDLCAYLSRLYVRWDNAYARQLAERLSLPWERPVGLLSGGQQRKVSILLAFAARAEVLLLDEPAGGLDPVARRELIDEIVEVIGSADGCTLLFSTHIVSDLERVADHIGIMDGGKMVIESPLDELQTRTKRVQIIFPTDRVPEGFALPGTIRSHVEGPVMAAVVRLEDEGELERLRRKEGVRVSVFPLGLEEMFINLFGEQTGLDREE